jgi:hypothetical protein
MLWSEAVKRLVHERVVWQDAYHSSGWKALTEVKPETMRQVSVGFVVYEDKQMVMLAQSIDTQQPEPRVADIMAIPKKSIESRRKYKP